MMFELGHGKGDGNAVNDMGGLDFGNLFMQTCRQ